MTLVTTLLTVGSRTFDAAMRPVVGVATVAIRTTVSLEHRSRTAAMDAAGMATLALLDAGLSSRYAEEVMARLLESGQVQSALTKAFDSAFAEQAVAGAFDSGVLGQVVTRLLASQDMWRLVEEIADSPSVTAAITQQGFGFADQVGDAVRQRSRYADLWLERKAHRAIHRRTPAPAPHPHGAPADEAT